MARIGLRGAARVLAAAAVAVSSLTLGCGLLPPPLEEDWIVAVDIAGEADARQAARVEDGRPPLPRTRLEESLLVETRERLATRLREFGAPNVIATESASPARLRISLPRLEDGERLRRHLESPGTVSFRPVEQETLPEQDALPPGDWHHGPPGEGGTLFLLGPTIVTEADFVDARHTTDEFGKPAVRIALSREAGARLDAHSSTATGDRLAILIDGRVRVAPLIQGAIGSDIVLTGSFSPAEVADLALRLRAGALPAPVRVEETGLPMKSD